jgi:hypothetical protein
MVAATRSLNLQVYDLNAMGRQQQHERNHLAHQEHSATVLRITDGGWA